MSVGFWGSGFERERPEWMGGMDHFLDQELFVYIGTCSCSVPATGIHIFLIVSRRAQAVNQHAKDGPEV